MLKNCKAGNEQQLTRGIIEMIEALAAREEYRLTHCRISSRISNEVPGAGRVVYDIFAQTIDNINEAWYNLDIIK